MSNNSNKDQFDMSDLGGSLPAAAAALSAKDRAGLVNALKDKLQNLAGKHTDILETLTPPVRKRVDVLRELQAVRDVLMTDNSEDNGVLLGMPDIHPTVIWEEDRLTDEYDHGFGDCALLQLSQHDELEAKFFEERAALESKYQKLYEPLYSKRYEIVNGVVEVDGVDEAPMIQGEDSETENEKGVPNFWLTAMKTNEILAEEITERDEEALKYLKDIKWCKLDDRKGFKLEFFFDTNPFFKNSVLTKTYHMIDDDDDPILEKAIGTNIEWYPGKCLTQKILKRKPKKGSKNAKFVIKTESCESFFNFFNPPQVPEDDDDDIDEDAAEDLQNLMEQDYDIGSTIRDKIIPHAVSWFTGEAAEGDEFEDIEGDDEDEDEDEEEDDDDDEDEDEDEDEEEEKSKKKKSAKAQAGEGQQGERPPECKQQ